ncbi:hypothetical protein Pan44_46070 [Caulifigura coniformis]|uniref:DUF58 domain-containing protein n=1 Tax=Caulifigura coniformis TaxID=2527983 RepID=A0A517SKB0_9PLAN|nr:DUF58 domain-containing protein [Caulifigura coniformis]QDT56551.1 hypothetical protein Pan44_46070 [Caulifigura coniformis]
MPEAPSSGVRINIDDLVRLKASAQGYSLLPRQPVHSILAGTHASRLRGRGLSFEELRRYFPGDDVRTIDWHVTARTRKPHVRVYSEERDRPLLLIVDQRPTMFFGSRRAMKSVAAAEVAALSAWRALAVGDRVGGLVFDGQELSEIEPHRSESRVLALFHAIVRMNQRLAPDSPAGTITLNQVLERAATVARHDSLVCVISDLSGADQETVRLMTRIQAHNDALLIFIHDPLEAELPQAGRLVMAQGERRLEVDTSTRKFRDDYAQEFENRVTRLKSLSLKRAVPLLEISTAEDVTSQVRRALGGAMQNRRRH